MLVLSRKQNQDVMIGDNVKVTVLKIKGNVVRLGIEAPRQVRVVRGELPPAELEDSINESITEITLVFDDQETTISSDGRQESSDDDSQEVALKFPRPSLTPKIKSAEKSAMSPESISEVSNERTSFNRISNGSSDPVIFFRDRLPTALQHNRLKQIVSEITARPNSARE